jgi:parallel beta-helix repeat protein
MTLNKIGIASHTSTGLQIHANNLTNNDLAGITSVKTDSSQIDGNSIQGSRNGIYLDSQSSGNIIMNNTAQNNDIDINNADGLPYNINSNDVQGNDCSVSNPSGGCSIP